MGGSGGGGSSGGVDYPDYMKAEHMQLLILANQFYVTASNANPYILTQIYDPLELTEGYAEYLTKYEESLPKDVTPYDYRTEMLSLTDSVVSKMLEESSSKAVLLKNAIDSWKPVPIDVVNEQKDIDNATAEALEDFYDLLNSSDIQNFIKSGNVDNRRKFYDEILPKYRAGMRDIGAVNTSAYKIGEALLFSRLLQDEFDYQAKIRGNIVSGGIPNIILKGLDLKGIGIEKKFNLKLQAMGSYDALYKVYADTVGRPQYSDAVKVATDASKITADIDLKTQVTNVTNKMDYNKTLVSAVAELCRQTYVMHSEYSSERLENNINQTVWHLELLKYLNDSLGAISSSAGTSNTAAKKNKARSAIGGAVSGAATGLALSGGNPIGAGVGAIAGGLMGLMG